MKQYGRIGLAVGVCLAAWGITLVPRPRVAAKEAIPLVVDAPLAAPAEQALRDLERALRARGLEVVRRKSLPAEDPKRRAASRAAFVDFFRPGEGADPSEYPAGIPQALSLMNSEWTGKTSAFLGRTVKLPTSTSPGGARRLTPARRGRPTLLVRRGAVARAQEKTSRGPAGPTVEWRPECAGLPEGRPYAHGDHPPRGDGDPA